VIFIKGMRKEKKIVLKKAQKEIKKYVNRKQSSIK